MAPRKRSAVAVVPAASFLVTLQQEDLDFLRIPASVYKKHKADLLKTKVQLSVSGKSEYSIDITDGAFTNGWKNFCTENGIEEGDTLVFKATGASTIACEVYGADGCGRPNDSRKKPKPSNYEGLSSDEEEHDEDRDNEQERNDGSKQEDGVATGITAALSLPDEEQHMVFTNCEVRLSIRKLDGTIRTETGVTATQTSPASRRTPAKKSKEAAAKDQGFAGPSVQPNSLSRSTTESTDVSPSKETSPAVNKSRVKSKPRVVSAKKLAQALSVEEAVTPPPIGARLNRPQSAELLADSPAEVSNRSMTTAKKRVMDAKAKAKALRLKAQKTIKKKPAATGESARKSKVEPQTPAEEAALAKAAAFTSSNRHHVLVLKKSSVAPSFCLNIPVSVAREFLPHDITEFKLLDAEDKSWNVRWLGNPKFTFSGGWCFFAQDHNLAKGDAIVLEMLGDNKIRVHIFRASESRGEAGGPEPVDAAALATAEGDDNRDKTQIVVTEEIVETVTIETITVDTPSPEKVQAGKDEAHNPDAEQPSTPDAEQPSNPDAEKAASIAEGIADAVALEELVFGSGDV